MDFKKPSKIDAKFMYRSCFKKAKFKSEKQAMKIAKKWGQRVYFCPICGCYHLTKLSLKPSDPEST